MVERERASRWTPPNSCLACTATAGVASVFMGRRTQLSWASARILSCCFSMKTTMVILLWMECQLEYHARQMATGWSALAAWPLSATTPEVSNAWARSQRCSLRWMSLIRCDSGGGIDMSAYTRCVGVELTRSSAQASSTWTAALILFVYLLFCCHRFVAFGCVSLPRDELPRFADCPAEYGGSGQRVCDR